MKILCVSLPRIVHNDQFDRLMGLVSQSRREKVVRFRKPKDQYRSLIGEAVVRHELGHVQIKEGRKGKPQVDGHHFNISHSGDWVVVVFGTNEVGVDVEQIRDIQIEDFFNHFHSGEVNWIDGELDRQKAFFKIWTLKESYIKATGNGIYQGLDSFAVTPDSFFCDSGNDAFFGTPKLDNNHALAWCSFEEPEHVEIRKWSFEEFYRQIGDG